LAVGLLGAVRSTQLLELLVADLAVGRADHLRGGVVAHRRPPAQPLHGMDRSVFAQLLVDRVRILDQLRVKRVEGRALGLLRRLRLGSPLGHRYVAGTDSGTGSYS